jgi:hypothetical protein
MTLPDLIAEARNGRSDQQALEYLAAIVVRMSADISSGYVRALPNRPVTLRLDDGPTADQL